MTIINQEEIRKRAFEIYLWRMEYNEAGDEVSDWLEAADEINQTEIDNKQYKEIREDWA